MQALLQEQIDTIRKSHIKNLEAFEAETLAHAEEEAHKLAQDQNLVKQFPDQLSQNNFQTNYDHQDANLNSLYDASF